VVLDDLFIHTTREAQEWLDGNLHVHFHFTPVGSSWINPEDIRLDRNTW